MTQDDLDRLRESCSFPPGIQVKIPEESNTILSARQGKVAFYEATFHALVIWHYYKHTLSLNEFSERMMSSGGNNTEDKFMEEATDVAGEEEYIRTIRRIENRILPRLLDQVLLSILGTKIQPSFLYWEPNISSSSSGAMSESWLPSKLKSNATKGVVIWEKRPRDKVFNISPREAKSKEKEALPPLVAKKAKSSATSSAPVIKGARLAMAPMEGILANPSAALGPGASMIGNPSVDEKILIGVNLLAVCSRQLCLGLPLMSKEQKATKELKEKIEAVARLEVEVAELKKNEALAKGKAIKEYKSLDDFQDAVEFAAFKYFGECFDFCKRQLLAHYYPNLGINLDGMGLDHDLFKEEKEEDEVEEKGEDKEKEENEEKGDTSPFSPLVLIYFCKHFSFFPCNGDM
ncbi:hypothetical protein Acr_00g0055780 [Actinidia rufa]|uniref:Uncharacterized protein n=1 Tax=Actinidia rufa TaxID=165716 RepID=A0A7J0DML3_9ERIC|nr:hypothetical protein Acr_00g0055780 [Actinidia rufa]